MITLFCIFLGICGAWMLDAATACGADRHRFQLVIFVIAGLSCFAMAGYFYAEPWK